MVSRGFIEYFFVFVGLYVDIFGFFYFRIVKFNSGLRIFLKVILNIEDGRED